jgi:hypothetical protein
VQAVKRLGELGDLQALPVLEWVAKRAKLINVKFEAQAAVEKIKATSQPSQPPQCPPPPVQPHYPVPEAQPQYPPGPGDTQAPAYYPPGPVGAAPAQSQGLTLPFWLATIVFALAFGAVLGGIFWLISSTH